MSSHNNRSRHNSNTSTQNNIHDKNRPGVPENIRMLEHIGDKSSVDTNVGYTELQRDIIEDNEQKLYNRRQHDTRFDLPEAGMDQIKMNHPLGVSTVHSHGDKGFDYRDFPDNIEQDHQNFDPYIQYLNSNGLIGLNKTRYITNYVNIDSRDRNKFPCTKNDSPIKLNRDPLSFNADILRIDITDVGKEIVERLTPGTKIIIRGLEESQLTLRSAVPDNFGNLVESFVFEEGKQYMKVDTNNNMDIQTGDIASVKEDYADIKVRFEGFNGDIRKRYLFNFNGFIVNTSPDPDDMDNTVISITENVYADGGTEFKVADFIIDKYGQVIEDNTDRPYLDDLSWTSFLGTDKLSDTDYFTDVTSALTSLPSPSIPTSFVEYMQYIENVQNITRPILFSEMTGTANDSFNRVYTENGDTYETTVNYILDQFTLCTQTSRIGNIPLNFLNMSHRIFFTASDVEANLADLPLTPDIPSSSNFFIELDREYQQTEFSFSQPMDSNVFELIVFETALSDVLVAFKHYGGVPTRSINAEYPLGPFSDAGFRFVIDVVTLDGRTFALIQLDKAGYLNRNFGGDCLNIALVVSEDSGSVQPNKYIIEFGRVYYKVVLIKMISSQFPIAQKAFTDGVTGGTRNNRFYWQNLDDGSIIYSVDIEPGNYTSDELETELETKVFEVLRFDEELPRNIPNVMKFDIDPNTDLVCITSFNFYKSPIEPFTSSSNFIDINTTDSAENLDPENQYYVFPSQFYIDFPKFTPSCQCFRIKINYPNHGLKRFDEIIIQNSINFGTIPANELNGMHIVTNVVDIDNFDIVLENINELPQNNSCNELCCKLLCNYNNIFKNNCCKSCDKPFPPYPAFPPFPPYPDFPPYPHCCCNPCPTTELPTTTECISTGCPTTEAPTTINTTTEEQCITTTNITTEYPPIDPCIQCTVPIARGGFKVEILTPIRFRIRFDQPDTIGVQLGFRSVGLCTSITPYDTKITNDVLYEDETLENVLSLINPDIDIATVDPNSVSIRNSVILSGPPYLLITCPEIENVRGRGTVKDIFYKINLRDNSRNNGSDDRVEPMAYDTFANSPVLYNEPLRRLEQLTLEFRTPDGELYDFNGVEHSFVLEIVTYEEIPEATSLQKH
jgi:hypothetical protein